MINNFSKRKYWVARDKNDALYVYLKEPTRYVSAFCGGDCRVITGDYRALFEFITWENSPWQIATD